MSDAVTLKKRRTPGELRLALGLPAPLSSVRIPAPPRVFFCDCSGDASSLHHRHPAGVCDRCGCDNDRLIPCAACLGRGSEVY